jgi:hypothetical protein
MSRWYTAALVIVALIIGGLVGWGATAMACTV